MKKNAGDISIGLVSVSDRAYEGSYPDLGIPALKDWLASAITSPYWLETRLIPDDKEQIEKTLHELVDEDRCSLILTTGGTRPGTTRPDTGCHPCRRHPGNAGVCGTDASDQSAFRPDRHTVPTSCRHLRTS